MDKGTPKSGVQKPFSNGPGVQSVQRRSSVLERLRTPPQLIDGRPMSSATHGTSKRAIDLQQHNYAEYGNYVSTPHSFFYLNIFVWFPGFRVLRNRKTRANPEKPETFFGNLLMFH